MAKKLNLLDLGVLDHSFDLDQLRRDIKNGIQLFWLTDEEVKQFKDLDFDASPEKVKQEFDLVREISGISDISGVGVNKHLLSVTPGKFK